jgi:hypothetical protein
LCVIKSTTIAFMAIIRCIPTGAGGFLHHPGTSGFSWWCFEHSWICRCPTNGQPPTCSAGPVLAFFSEVDRCTSQQVDLRFKSTSPNFTCEGGLIFPCYVLFLQVPSSGISWGSGAGWSTSCKTRRSRSYNISALLDTTDSNKSN